MKKKCVYISRENRYSRLRKILLTMKLSVFLFLFGILSAQGNEIFSQTSLSIHVENTSVEEVLEQIQKQCNYDFIYDYEYVKELKAIDVDFKDASLDNVLYEVLKNTSLDYRVEDKMIVLFPRENVIPKQKESISTPVQQQKKVITGQVTDKDGSPLPGVSVFVKGTTTGVATDVDGNYTLKFSETGGVFVFSFVGMISQEIKYTNQPVLNVTLFQDQSQLGEVVVTGYQTISKERLTGSFNVINEEKLKETPSLNVVNSLESQITGMQVSVLSGDQTFTYNNTSKTPSSGTRTVGASDYNVTIRGQGTLTGERFPLVVVDGAISEMDMSAVNPDDIASISVLKDASAASIYGVRAANGVIVITTKKGKENQAPTINFSTNIMMAGKPDLSYVATMNSKEQLNYEKELVDRGFIAQLDNSSYYTAQNIVSKGSQLALQLKAGSISEEEYNVQVAGLSKIDNRNQISKYFLQRASSQNYNLSVNGGTDNSNYYYSTSYSKENPNTIGNSGERLTFTLNNYWKLFKKITLSTSFKGTFFDYKKNGISISSLYSSSNTTLMPYDRLADENGTGISYDRYDPTWVSSLGPVYKDWTYNYLDELKNADNTQKVSNYAANIDLKIPLFNGLTGTVFYAMEKSNGTSKSYYNQDTYYFRNIVNYYTYPTASTNSLGITTGGIHSKILTYENNYSLRGQLDYNRIFKDDHQITALAGAEIRETNIGMSSFSLFGYNPDTGLTNTRINYSNTPTYAYVAGYSPTSYTTFNPGGYPDQADKKRRFLSYYSNFSYDYKSKYFLSGSVRYDDYNNFGVDRKYRATPLWSTGIKWNIGREDFMSGVNWISNLGIRATYGVNGNLSLSTYPFTYISISGNDYTTGQEYASVISAANPELKWEKVYVTNLAVDFGLFKGKLNGSLDYYQKNSKDLLYAYPIGAAYYGNIGNGNLTRNIASMKTEGVDFGLNSKLFSDKNWDWNMRVNLSYNTNKITDARFKETDYVNYFGYYPQGIGLIKGYANDKLLVYKNAGLDENGLTQIYDENGGVISASTTSITSFGVFKDAGRTTAPFFGSWNTRLSYKQFSFYAMMSYQFGNVFLKPSISQYSTSSYRLQYDLSADIAKRWQKPGDEEITNVPGLNGTALDINYSQMRYSNSDINVLKGDYIRLRQVSFSYDFPEALVEKVHLKSAQIGLTVNNLGLLWTANKEGYDPDFIAYPGRIRSLPATKSFLFTLSVKF
ncbi:SusC/RagA family TonB-linked outer membrane protein [Labilibaculum euxinus]